MMTITRSSSFVRFRWVWKLGICILCRSAGGDWSGRPATGTYVPGSSAHLSHDDSDIANAGLSSKPSIPHFPSYSSNKRVSCCQ